MEVNEIWPLMWRNWQTRGGDPHMISHCTVRRVHWMISNLASEFCLGHYCILLCLLPCMKQMLNKQSLVG